MADRPTLLARPSAAPTTQPTQSGSVSGAFGDYRGLGALGQGLTNAGGTGMQYATDVKQEMERRRIQDHQLKVSNLIDTAMMGVQKQWDTKLASGERIDDPYGYMEQLIADAQTSVSDTLGEVQNDPLFRKAVPVEAMKQHWIKASDNMLREAARHDGHVRMQDRIDNLHVMTTAAFQAVPVGAYAETLGELSQKHAIINGLQVPQTVKDQLSRQLAGNAYEKVLRGIQSGFRAPDDVVNNPLFDPGQQRMLDAMNAKLNKPEIPVAEANKILNSTLEKAIKNNDLSLFDGEAGQSLQLSADAIANSETTPEAKRYAYARIALAKKEIELTRNNFNDGALKGAKLYQRLTNMAEVLSNPATTQDYFKALGITGAHAEDESRFLTNVKAKVQEQLSLINTGKGNLVVDRSDAVSPIAAAVTAAFNGGNLGRADAQRYVTVAREQYKELGIPANLQVLVPAAISNTVIDRVWNGDNNNALRMITDIGTAFGSDALGSVANHFLAPSNVPSSGAVDNNRARASAYGALFKIAAADTARTELGADSLALAPHLKSWLDDLTNYEKNQHMFPQHARMAAEIAFNQVAFKDVPTAKELLNAQQINTITSKAQSLTGIAQGLYWQNGQSNALAEGFKSMAMRIIQSRAYSAGIQDQGSDAYAREKLAAEAGDNLNRALAGVYTVVDSSNPENGRRVRDLWPTKMYTEDAFALPMVYGAADAVDMGNQLSGALQYISYYGPRKDWNRSSLGNAAVYTANALWRNNPVLAPFMPTGSSMVIDLPAHLSLDPARFYGITPSQWSAGGETTTQVIKDAINASRDPATNNSIAFSQHGAWRYNWKTDTVEAMIFPGRATTAAGPSVETPGAAQPLMYNYGTPQKPLLRPVSLRAEDIRKFEAAQRLARINYLNRKNPDLSGAVTDHALNNTITH